MATNESGLDYLSFDLSKQSEWFGWEWDLSQNLDLSIFW